MHYQDELNEAVKRLAGGSTVGMVDAELKRNGVPSGPRVEVLEMARGIINRRARIKHAAIFVLGALVFAAGSFWLYVCAQNRIPQVRIPGAIMGFGLLAVIYGIYFSFQNEV